MILLDTNVVSETMKPQPSEAMLAWLDEQAAETLFLSSVTVAEITFGIAALPEGRRKNGLAEMLAHVTTLFEGRVMPFDLGAAQAYGELAARARAAGRGFPTPDGYIAAIAIYRGLAVATRDSTAFDAAGLEVIDPWRAAR